MRFKAGNGLKEHWVWSYWILFLILLLTCCMTFSSLTLSNRKVALEACQGHFHLCATGTQSKDVFTNNTSNFNLHLSLLHGLNAD